MVAFFNPPPFMKRKAPLSFSFIGNVSAAGSTATYTFTAQSIGAAASSRIIVLSLCRGLANALTSVTINGVAATIAADVSGSSARSTIVYLAVPAGSTADIVVTYVTGNSANFVMGIYAIYDAIGSAPLDSGALSAASGTITIPLDTAVNGCVIMCNSVCASPFAYTGITSNFQQTAGNVFCGGSGPTSADAVDQNFAFNGNRAAAAVSWK